MNVKLPSSGQEKFVSLCRDMDDAVSLCWY